MLPSYYEFMSPVKIISGYKALDNLPFELGQLMVTRPLLVTDQGVVQAGLLKLVEGALADGGMSLAAVFDRTPPDSSLEVVRQAAQMFRAENCDSLIALGGGSAMDTAKGVNIVVSEGAEDLAPLAGAEMLAKPQRPLIAIPTTAGTGSEVTGVAVIADHGRSLKMVFTSHHLLPKLAVLDPRLTLSLPPRLTAATGMDALSHAVESWLGLQKNPLSDAHAFAAIVLIQEHLRVAVGNGRDAQARLALANAATCAGIAFSNSMVGVVHSLGHATGAVCQVPHGVAMGIFLPFGLEHNLDKVGPLIGELLLPLAGAEVYAATPPERRALRCIKEVRGLQRDLHRLCGLPYTLKEAGVPLASLERIAMRTLDDGALTYNPEALDLAGAMRILKRAYE